MIARGWVEKPTEKQKKSGNATALYPIPRGGGVAIYIAMVTAVLIFAGGQGKISGIMIAGLLMLLVGLGDDIREIDPRIRLLTNILAAVIVVGFGIKINFISSPFGGVIDLSFGLWADLLTILWIVWCANIVGWSAGVEGQLPGITAISAIVIGILGTRYIGDPGQLPVIILAGALAGSYLGFLPYNFFPQSIMPGYSGKSLAGFMLGVLAILSGAKLATLMLLLGIPMFDAIAVIAKRIYQGKSIVLADDQHLHHQLLKNNWSRRQIAVFYWAVSLILGVVALNLNSQQKFYCLIGVVMLFVGFTLKVYRRI
jgi:UDP-GlcNAc:undecaprenyl-phosphate GlcNAc-1-phosphate transferase